MARKCRPRKSALTTTESPSSTELSRKTFRRAHSLPLASVLHEREAFFQRQKLASMATCDRERRVSPAHGVACTVEHDSVRGIEARRGLPPRRPGELSTSSSGVRGLRDVFDVRATSDAGLAA